jgi:hypothetical protein
LHNYIWNKVNKEKTNKSWDSFMLHRVFLIHMRIRKIQGNYLNVFRECDTRIFGDWRVAKIYGRGENASTRHGENALARLTRRGGNAWTRHRENTQDRRTRRGGNAWTRHRENTQARRRQDLEKMRKQDMEKNTGKTWTRRGGNA